jgi:hypothetical protein
MTTNVVYHALQQPPTRSAIYDDGQLEPQHCVPRSRPDGRRAGTFGRHFMQRLRLVLVVATLTLVCAILFLMLGGNRITKFHARSLLSPGSQGNSFLSSHLPRRSGCRKKLPEQGRKPASPGKCERNYESELCVGTCRPSAGHIAVSHRLFRTRQQRCPSCGLKRRKPGYFLLCDKPTFLASYPRRHGLLHSGICISI